LILLHQRQRALAVARPVSWVVRIFGPVLIAIDWVSYAALGTLTFLLFATVIGK